MRKRLRQQEQQQAQKRLRQQEPVQQREPPVQVPELRRVFHHKRSVQEPTEQQQEQRVSLSIPRELLKIRNYYLTFKMRYTL